MRTCRVKGLGEIRVAGVRVLEGHRWKVGMKIKIGLVARKQIHILR